MIPTCLTFIPGVEVTLPVPEFTALTYQAERAITADGRVYWTVVDSTFDLHVEACAFLASLRARDASSNTEKTYAPRIALYLTHCARNGIDWARPTLAQMSELLRVLVDEPMPNRGTRPQPEPRYRTRKTANAIVGTICGYLQFCAKHGWVPPEVAALLTEPKYLYYAPPGFDPGEDNQNRMVHRRAVKYLVAVEGYKWLTDEQIDALITKTRHARDRFLISLMAVTGARIGEILGLRREDLHLLTDSTALGCSEAGPHVHVRRRLNTNGALAKARKPRVIPVDAGIPPLYADYQYERDAVPGAAMSDMVFVNLFREPLGSPMKYHTVKELFDRLAARAGITARPHMIRHSAITRWIRNGTRRDVARSLAGHVAEQSIEPYVHSTSQERREAVERVAEQRRSLA